MGLSCQAGSIDRPLGRPLAEGEPYDVAPVPVTTVVPVYPEFAREAQITGTVVLHVHVGKDGHVKTANVVRGVTGLNDAAIYAASHWIFKPAERSHEPVAAWYEITFDLP